MLGLRSQPPNVCSRKLERGQVKRVPFTGGLVGYFLACPGCGFKASYLREEGDFQEASVDGATLLVGIGRPPPCIACRKKLAMVAGKLEVT